MFQALRRSKSSVQSIFTSIHRRTRGIVFLGTPHHGSGMADLGKTMANIAALSLKDSNNNLLRSLRVDSETLRNIQDDFMKMLNSKDFFVYSFQEGHGFSGWKGIHGKVPLFLSTKTPCSATNLLRKVVNDFSSRFDEHPQQVLVDTIEAGHTHMPKFANIEDEGYRRVTKALLHQIHLIHEKLQPEICP